MTASGWTCRRVAQGVVCDYWNPPRTRKCGYCGKTRPAKRRPAHMAALDLPYEHYVELNGGELCGICGSAPKPGRRLNRDHAHVGDGTPRGLLCAPCNRFLVAQRYGLTVTAEWLEQATAYLRRTLA